MINTLNKLELEGNHLNIINTTYEKSKVNIRLNGERLKAFPLRSGTRQRCLLSPFLFNILLELLGKKKIF